MRIQLWHATVSGALAGLAVGICLQVGREIQEEKRLIAEMNSSADFVHTVTFIKPYAIPILICFLFAFIGSLTQVLWSLRRQ